MRMYILNHTSHANPRSQPVHQWQLPSIIFLFQCKGRFINSFFKSSALMTNIYDISLSSKLDVNIVVLHITPIGLWDRIRHLCQAEYRLSVSRSRVYSLASLDLVMQFVLANGLWAEGTTCQCWPRLSQNDVFLLTLWCLCKCHEKGPSKTFDVSTFCAPKWILRQQKWVQLISKTHVQLDPAWSRVA